MSYVKPGSKVNARGPWVMVVCTFCQIQLCTLFLLKYIYRTELLGDLLHGIDSLDAEDR